jgi:iron(III) transport system substrate-binding protein
MRTVMRRMATCAAVAALALTGAACSGSSGSTMAQGQPLVIDGETIASAELVDAASAEGQLMLYTALNENTTEAMNQAFTQDTGIDVEYLRAPSSRLSERIKSEMGAGNLPADAVGIADPALVTELDASGLFQQHVVEADAKIGSEYKGPGGHYYTYTASATVMAYNKEVFKGEPPTTWAQLPEVTAQNRFGLVQAGASAGGWRLALFMRDRLGGGTDSYWKALAAHPPLIDNSSGSLVEKLARGETAIAAARPPEVAASQADGAPLEFIWPTDGVPMFGTYMGVTAKAQHPNAAKLYLNWVMSKRGQTVQSAEGGDYSVRDDVAPPMLNGVSAPPLAEIKPDLVSDQESISRRDAEIPQWNRIFGVTG